MKYLGNSNRRFDYETDIELGPMLIGVVIEYDVSPYVPATYMDPPEGGEVEDILGVSVMWVEGEYYKMDREELGDWLTDIEELALEYVVEYFDHYELLESAQQEEW